MQSVPITMNHLEILGNHPILGELPTASIQRLLSCATTRKASYRRTLAALQWQVPKRRSSMVQVCRTISISLPACTTNPSGHLIHFHGVPFVTGGRLS